MKWVTTENRKLLENRIVNATGQDADYWNQLMHRYTAHDDIIALILNSENYIPSFVCTPRSRSDYDIQSAKVMTSVADAFDSMVDDLKCFYGGFKHICRV